jgi:diguanylate cyclase (GGDEF)-like protein/PAS domain S-box-containing protein
MTGYGTDEVVGRSLQMLGAGQGDDEFTGMITQQLQHVEHWQGEVQHRRRSGEVYPAWLHVSVIRDAANRPGHYVFGFLDISDRKQAEARIEYMAFHDPLTGLPNRRLAIERLDLAIALADRSGSRTALMFLDLDNFKTINDSFGHAVGDLLLQAVASRLMLCIRDSDTICRQGGDEFLIVLGNVTDSDAITTVTEKILEALAPTFNIEGKELSTSSSIGIAVFPDDGRDIDTLLKRADTAMYHAKEAGRNAYSFFTEQMNLDAVEHQQIRVGLLHAMERGEFRLHYQPQIDLTSGRVIGAKALIRWHHPDRGLLTPEHFISIAEESGLIVPIGAWVLREACRQAAAWRKTGLPRMVIAVNVSAIQFKRGDIEACVRQALDESGLPPECLELELTESVLIHDTDSVLATVQRLKSLGVMLSIDDFGTGYSSLSYLTRFKVDKLKIDRSFVCDMKNQPGNASMVRAIIQMALSLNLTTIAEGVEDAELVEFLRRQNCHEAQGYYFSRPLPAIEFAHYVALARAHTGVRAA